MNENELQVFTRENTISSREVAEMMEVRHTHMLDKIDKINQVLTDRKIGSSDYWIESSYIAGNGEERREYQVTKKGCELIAHKSSGEKGIVFTVRYMDKFEEMEKKLQKQLPRTYIEALEQLLASEKEKERLSLENKAQLQIIGELQPKADYTDIILKSNSSMNVSQIAKDYGMSAKKLNSILHDLGVQYKSNGQWLLYSNFHDKGYTKSETGTYDNGNQTYVHTKWTQKGRLFLYELLKKNDVLPIIEQ